jgi:hypothetical protein
MAGSDSLGCSLCGRRPALQRGFELSLRRERDGRLFVRESDGLLPICDGCLLGLVHEPPRAAWPLAALVAGCLLLLRGNVLLGAGALLAGVSGALRSLARPGRAALQRRLRERALVFGSVPLTGFEPDDVREIVLERDVSVLYVEDGTVEARRRSS